jgi:hypothetical protein
MERVEGRIVAIYETWPLQLALEGPRGRIDVALSAETAVSAGGRAAAPSDLHDGARVAIEGETTAPGAMIAARISILAR